MPFPVAESEADLDELLGGAGFTRMAGA